MLRTLKKKALIILNILFLFYITDFHKMIFRAPLHKISIVDKSRILMIEIKGTVNKRVISILQFLLSRILEQYFL